MKVTYITYQNTPQWDGQDLWTSQTHATWGSFWILRDCSSRWLKGIPNQPQVSTTITKALCPLFATEDYEGMFFRTLM